MGKINKNRTYLESLVLQHLLDCNFLFLGSRSIRLLLAQHLGRENDTETSISDDFAVGVRDGPFVAALSIGSGDGDNASGVIRSCGRGERQLRVLALRL